MTDTDDFGAQSRDWINVIDDDNWLIYHSGGFSISVARTDFGVEVHHVDPATGAVNDFDGSPFPYRAGAMEAVRRWLRDNSLTMIPSPEQQAQPWHGASTGNGPGASAQHWDHSYREKYDAKEIAKVRATLDAAPVPDGPDRQIMAPTDPTEIAAQLNALIPKPQPLDDPNDIAAMLNNLMKGE